MYLGEARNEQEKHDLAIIIEETLKQRIEGVKNEKGVWITPAFPKLIYVLEEDNIHEGTKYWELTKLAARCTAKRMCRLHLREENARAEALQGETPGHGDVYTCMGCRSFLTPDRSGNGWNNIANAGNYEPASRNTTAASTKASSRSTSSTWRSPPAARWTSSGVSLTSGWSFATRP